MKLTDLSDEELMALYQTGSEEAFLVLYGRHSEKVYGFLRSKVWNDEKANELFQEVFLKMHRSKHLYNQSLPAVPWMFSILRSILVDSLRSEKKFERSKKASDLAETTEASESKASEVADLMARLPHVQRQAVEMRYVDEKTFEEIAVVLKTSPVNVRKIVSRAVGHLKALTKKGD